MVNTSRTNAALSLHVIFVFLKVRCQKKLMIVSFNVCIILLCDHIVVQLLKCLWAVEPQLSEQQLYTNLQLTKSCFYYNTKIVFVYKDLKTIQLWLKFVNMSAKIRSII